MRSTMNFADFLEETQGLENAIPYYERAILMGAENASVHQRVVDYYTNDSDGLLLYLWRLVSEGRPDLAQETALTLLRM